MTQGDVEAIQMQLANVPSSATGPYDCAEVLNLEIENGQNNQT